MYLHSKRANLFVEKFTSLNKNYDIINLGNSHGGNILYDSLNGKSFQRAGNTIYYDLQNYKFLAPNLNENAVVILPVSYNSFGLDENRTDYANPDAFVNSFYMYLPKSDIYNYSFKKHIGVYLNTVKVNFESVIDERFFHEAIPIDSTVTIAEKMEHHSIGRAKTHMKMASYSDPEKNIKYLGELIEKIIENNHKPVIVTMPFTDNYNEKFSESWLNTYYYNHVREVVEKYDVTYLDYSNDLRFSLNDSLFANSDHLNLKGKKIFSKILFEDLRKYKLLKQ